MIRQVLSQAQVYRHVLRHPLNRGQVVAATTRWLRWHLGSRLVPGPVAVPFVENTTLLVSPGMTGATMNIYCGLSDASDMGFVLHALRPSSVFLDVGANVGAFTVLASGAAKARTFAIEALPATCEKLRRNVLVNALSETVQVFNVAVGEQAGSALFSTDQDTMNHIVGEGSSHACEVPMMTIDEILQGNAPDLIKIDIEGYELPALRGADATLRDERLKAIILEIGGGASRYGFREEEAADLLISKGFVPTAYDPISRTLTQQADLRRTGNNVIFVRNVESLQSHLRQAPSYRLGTGLTL